MLSLLIFLFEVAGVLFIIRYAYRKWCVADLKEKEAELLTLEKRGREVERIKRKVKENPKSIRQRIDDFYNQL